MRDGGDVWSKLYMLFLLNWLKACVTREMMPTFVLFQFHRLAAKSVQYPMHQEIVADDIAAGSVVQDFPQAVDEAIACLCEIPEPTSVRSPVRPICATLAEAEVRAPIQNRCSLLQLLHDETPFQIHVAAAVCCNCSCVFSTLHVDIHTHKTKHSCTERILSADWADCM